MKKIFLAVAVLFNFIFVQHSIAGVDGSIFVDKKQTTLRVESWGNPVGPVEFGWYGKVNFPAVGNANFFGEAQADYLPIVLGPVKLGVEANVQVADPSETPLVGRAYLAAKVGPFLLRYSPAQTDSNHKFSVCWFQQFGKFKTFGYYDRNFIHGQKALNIAEGYVGYEIYKKATLIIGIKPTWNDGQSPKINPGMGLRWQF